jgi:hypothetical protein
LFVVLSIVALKLEKKRSGTATATQ